MLDQHPFAQRPIVQAAAGTGLDQFPDDHRRLLHRHPRRASAAGRIGSRPSLSGQRQRSRQSPIPSSACARSGNSAGSTSPCRVCRGAVARATPHNCRAAGRRCLPQFGQQRLDIRVPGRPHRIRLRIDRARPFERGDPVQGDRIHRRPYRAQGGQRPRAQRCSSADHLSTAPPADRARPRARSTSSARSASTRSGEPVEVGVRWEGHDSTQPAATDIRSRL